MTNTKEKGGEKEKLLRCPVCQNEISADCSFCPNCGHRLFPPISVGNTLPQEDEGTGPQKRSNWSGIRVVAVIITVLLVVAALTVVVPSLRSTANSNSSFTPPNCPQNGSSKPVNEPNPDYDVQSIMAFTPSYTQLEFNVTAIAQCDSNGYGPSYLLNGLSNTGYWYQVGINWDWPLQGGGYDPGFGFVSEAWAPGGLTRSPASIVLSGTVNKGDTVELSLSFTNGQVVASAHDLNTGGSGSMSYPAHGGTTFVGLQAQQTSSRFSFATRGYFTGLMTEWYHVSPSDNQPELNATYSEDIAPIPSATLGVDEWNFTAVTPTSVFSSIANNGNPIGFSAQPNELQQFRLNGLDLSADAYEFVTGT